jgi:hypothetical protein
MDITIKDYSHKYQCWFYGGKLQVIDFEDLPL